MKISIIIPVYNGEEYILQCYDSLKRQEHSDWEAIFVNDGSSDGSLKLLEQIHAKDNRCKYISEPNSRQIVARYNGIDLAIGGYCVFLDVDDTLQPNALQIINGVVSRFNPDIVMFNGIRVNRDTGMKYKMWDHLTDSPYFYKHDEYQKIRAISIESRRLNNICFKAIKTSILKSDKSYASYRFIRNEEDLLMQLPYFDLAKNLYYVPQDLYLYTINEESSSNTYDSYFYKSACFIYHELLRYGKKWRVNDYKRICNTRICEAAIFSVISACGYLDKSKWNKIVKEIVKTKEFRESSKWSRNNMPISKKLFAEAMKIHAYEINYLVSKYELAHGYDS